MKNNNYIGILIALDGPNGSGKTTLRNSLKENLINSGYDVCVTAEPTATELGDYVREFAETHNGISLSFATWISPEFQLYIINDYRRIKTEENSRLSLNWNLNREISKLNYRIHTEAIKGNLIPEELTKEQISYKYANEADLLNVALFGMTAKQWRDKNTDKKGNMRDYAGIDQLLVLTNMESYNAILIDQGTPMSERLVLLRELAVKQMKTMQSLNLGNLPGNYITEGIDKSEK